MTPLFAQIPEPKSLLDFLLAVGFLSSIVTNVLVIVRSGHAQKREVSFADRYASRPELETVEQRVARLEARLEAVRQETKEERNGLLHAGEERVLRLQERMDEMAKDVHDRLDSLNHRFEEMPLKLIQLLQGARIK